MMKKKYAKPDLTEVEIKMGQVLVINSTWEVLSPKLDSNVSEIEENDPDEDE